MMKRQSQSEKPTAISIFFQKRWWFPKTTTFSRKLSTRQHETKLWYCAFHDSTTHTDYECRAQKRLKYHNNQILTVTEEEQDRAKDEELKATPLKLIGCANSLNEPIGVVGDSGSAVCLVALSQVLRTKLKILAANRTKINKGIGNLCIVKSQGLTQFPIKIEGKTATILARVIKDEDMPLGTQLLIGNNHLAQQETVVDYREMIV